MRFARVMLLMLMLAGAMPSIAAAQSSWELMPYQIQVYVAIEPAPQLTPQFQQDILREVIDRTDAIVGSAWYAKVDPAPLGLDWKILHDLDSFSSADVPSEALKLDKVLLLGISANPLGFQIVARELDVRSRLWGTSIRRQVSQPALVKPTAIEAVVSAFSPLAIVESVENKMAKLIVRAARLPTRDKTLAMIPAGTLFRPVIRTNDREGNLKDGKEPQALAFTYLTVLEQTPAGLNCELHTGLRSPLSARRRGRTEQLAVRVTPPNRHTLVQVVDKTDINSPLHGLEIYAYNLNSPETTRIGRTDRRGMVLVPPTEPPMRILVIKSGNEFLARLPLVPGLDATAQALATNDDSRLEVEGFISGVQLEVVNLIARRAILMARIRARIDQGNLADAKSMLEELRAMKTANELQVLLNERRNQVFVPDPRMRARVVKLFDDTALVITRNLDAAAIQQVELEVNNAQNKTSSGS